MNLGVIDWNPWPVRRRDLDRPDELRVDLDPMPDVAFDEVRAVAQCVREVLDEHGLTGFPKTSGSRGIHVNVRIHPQRGFQEVRRAALALAREVERRMPGRATSKWWKEERIGVFVDYNQNARDRTVASAYSVRAVPDARVSCPFDWRELADVEPAELRLDTLPARLREHGDPSASIDEHPGSLDSLLELAARDEAAGPRRRALAPELPQGGGGGAACGTKRAEQAPPSTRRRRPLRGAPRGPAGGNPRRLASAQLVEGALARRLVVAPADDLRAVADAPVARVVVADLDDQLRSQLTHSSSRSEFQRLGSPLPARRSRRRPARAVASACVRR